MRRRALAVVAASLLVGALVPAGASAGGGSARIGDSDDPTAASVLMSQASFADDRAGFVVIGRNDVFADNPGGAGLAGGDARCCSCRRRPRGRLGA